MPTYGFKCKSCETEFDRFLKIAEMDNPLSEPCPNCNKVEVARVVSGGTYAFMTPEALGRIKAPADFRNYMSAVKKANPGCSLKDR